MVFSVEKQGVEMLDDASLENLALQGVTAISVPYDFIETAPIGVIKERASALAAHGIKADTSHPRFGSYNTENSLVNQYDIPRKRYFEQLKFGFERLSILGVRVAPLHTGGCCTPSAPDWALELCAESIFAILETAKDCGLLLALENTFYYDPMRWDGAAPAAVNGRPKGVSDIEYDDIDKLCRLIDTIASPNVKGCFDAGHAHYLGSLAGDHEKMGGRIALYHIHDNNRAYDMHLTPGYGTLNWEELGRLMMGNEAASPFFIEASPWTENGYGLMLRQTQALLSGCRNGESRRCLKCGCMLISDDSGDICGCNQ